MAKRLFYGYFFGTVLCFGIYFVFGISAVLSSLGIFLLYFFITYIIHYIIRMVAQKEPKKFIEFFIVGLYRFSIISSFFLLALGVFCFYQNNTAPAMFPLYTVSNGEKTIEFQTMSHIATEKFYKDVRSNILNSKREGSVLFYEGVKAGSPENQELFEKLLGIEFSADLYENYSKLYGIVSQNNRYFLGMQNTKDFNVDLDIDSIIDIYIQKNLTPEQQEEYKKSIHLKEGEKIQYHLDIGEAQDINTTLLDTLSRFDEKQLVVVRYFNTALLNFFFKNQTLQDTAFELLKKEDIFKIILDERNKYLAEEIEKSDFSRIFIIYGMLHFDGVLQELQAQDSNWKIVKTEQYYPLVRE